MGAILAGFPKGVFASDVEGWKSGHPYLTDAMDSVRPSIVVEVGVCKGASTLKMAARLKELDLDAAVIAIDTWLGSSEHWINEEWFAHLGMMQGQPSLLRKFMGNVVEAGLADVIVPVPLDFGQRRPGSRASRRRPDVIHIDGGHDYETVRLI